MSFELFLPRDAVPPAVANALAKLGVEAADARLDGDGWIVTLRDGRMVRLRPRVPPFVVHVRRLRAGRRA